MAFLPGSGFAHLSGRGRPVPAQTCGPGCGYPRGVREATRNDGKRPRWTLRSTAPAGLPAGTAGYVDHIGIAVRDLEQGLTLYRDLLGLELERTRGGAAGERPRGIPEAGPRRAPWPRRTAGPHVRRGAIAAFIAKKGPGLHHIAVAAVDIEPVLERCRAAGLALIDEKPRSGAGGKQIAFVHPEVRRRRADRDLRRASPASPPRARSRAWNTPTSRQPGCRSRCPVRLAGRD